MVYDIFSSKTISKKRTLTASQKNQLWLKAHKKCQACGFKLNSPFDGHTGHRKAHSKGGGVGSRNVVMLCMKCNKDQGTMKWEKFLEKRYRHSARKYKKFYVVCMKENRKIEIDKINKDIHKLKTMLHKTKAIAKTNTINNKIYKLKEKLFEISHKYKLLLGPVKSIKKPIKKEPIKKKAVKKKVKRRKSTGIFDW